MAFDYKKEHKEFYMPKNQLCIVDVPLDGYFDYVVPPLEGFWWQNDIKGIDYSRKEDYSKVEFLTYDEGLCVQCIHIGPYDDEPATVEKMHDFMTGEGYELDITEKRLHHEIYLSDARRVAPEKQKTVIRHPVKRISGDEENCF